MQSRVSKLQTSFSPRHTHPLSMALNEPAQRKIFFISLQDKGQEAS